MRTNRTIRVALLAVCALASANCAAAREWLANGPELRFAVGAGPLSAEVGINPGKTVADAAASLASAVESVASADAGVSPPAPDAK